MNRYDTYCSAILLSRLCQIKDGINDPHTPLQQHDLLMKEMAEIKEELRIRGYACEIESDT